MDNQVDFDSWYTSLQDDLVGASHAKYQLYQHQLSQTQAHLDSLLDSATASLKLLASLSDSFHAVESQTTEFQAECEGILADQTRASALADDIADNLQYYTYLEPITRRLNAPGAGSLVRRSEFPEILSNLDACLDYMLSHVPSPLVHLYPQLC